MYGWRIKSVKSALQSRGLDTGDLSVDDLTSLGHLDQYHYYGTAACDEAIDVLGLNSDRRVLDIGSGIGGPARYLADKTGCTVHGVEMKDDLVAMSRKLTDRVGLDDHVTFTNDDAANIEFSTDRYDHAVMWLVLIHIDNPQALLESLTTALHQQGTILIEAIANNGLSSTQQDILRQTIDASDVLTESELVEYCSEAGFVDIKTCDLTDAWTNWTQHRYTLFTENQEPFVDLHGEQIYQQRREVYRTMADLFSDNALRGVRLTARVSDDTSLELSSRQQTSLQKYSTDLLLEM